MRPECGSGVEEPEEGGKEKWREHQTGIDGESRDKERHYEWQRLPWENNGGQVLGGDMTSEARPTTHAHSRYPGLSRPSVSSLAHFIKPPAMSTLAPPASATPPAASPPSSTPLTSVPEVVTVTSTALASASTSGPPPESEVTEATASDAKGKEAQTKPVLELLPPSPTRLSFSDRESSIEESDVDAPRPSPISELVRICAGGGAVDRAESVRSARIEVETEDGTIVRPSSRFLGIGLSSPFGSPSSPSSTRSAGSSSGGLLGFGKGTGVWSSGGSSSGSGGRLLRLALPWKRKDVTEPIRVTTSPTPSARDAPFAKELEVKGWQIVGGRNFDDKARVGAYVGACQLRR